MSKTAPQTMTVEQFAARESVTPGRVRQWIQEGRLPVLGENPYLIDAGTPRPARQARGPKPAAKKKG